VVVRNDNDGPVRFYWGAEGRRRADGFVDIPANGARKIKVLRRSPVTVVLAGTDYAVDVHRHLRVPHDGSALPPGVEHGTVSSTWGSPRGCAPGPRDLTYSAKASGGGHAQTRLRSPYAWSIRATGGQYLSGSTPVGKTARSRS
jgi:hypothetical protein